MAAVGAFAGWPRRRAPLKLRPSDRPVRSRSFSQGSVRRLFLLQPSLSDHHSHHHGEALGWIDACRARGVAPRLFVNRQAEPAIVAALDAVPAFAHESDTVLERDPVCQHIADFLTIAGSVAEGCALLDREAIGADDVAVVAFATERDLLGAAMWLATLAPGRRPRFVFVFHVPDFTWTTDAARQKVRGDYSRLRYAMKRLKAVLPPEKIIVFAISDKLATALGPMLDHPCRVGPMPTFYAEESAEAVAGPRVDLRAAGEYRTEKGAGIIAPVFSSIARQRPGTRFAVQIVRPEWAQALQSELAPLAAVGSSCVFEYALPDHALFQARLRQSDVLLLAYQWQRYALRSSGLFSEAVAFGIPAVVPDQSWMADRLAEGWGAGMVFGDYTVEAIAAAAIEALDARVLLRERAARRAAEWRRTNCPAALLDLIIARTGA